jgi:chaperone modulatory protein CbpM
MSRVGALERADGVETNMAERVPMLMKYSMVRVCQGQLVDDEACLSLRQLCQLCEMPSAEARELINEGILDPVGEGPHKWRFPLQSVTRVRKMHRLRRDLGLSLAGLALALELLERIEGLESALARSGEAPARTPRRGVGDP